MSSQMRLTRAVEHRYATGLAHTQVWQIEILGLMLVRKLLFFIMCLLNTNFWGNRTDTGLLELLCSIRLSCQLLTKLECVLVDADAHITSKGLRLCQRTPRVATSINETTN